MKKPRPKVAVAAGALALGGLAAAVIPAAPAVAYYSSPMLLDVRVTSPATLVAKGAALNVPVEATCAGADFATVFVTVTQKVGKAIAGGFGSQDVWCNGQRQKLTVTVTAQVGGKAFARGTGYASAQIDGCNATFCGRQPDSRTISIKN